MKRFFGLRTSAPTAAEAGTSPGQQHGQDQIAEALRLLELREAHLDRLIDKECQTARRHSVAGQKKEALEAIKRKKIHDKERERLAGQKLNLIQQEAMLQAVRFNGIVIDATQAGAVAIEREIKRAGGIEGAEAVQDRMDDALADGTDLLDASARLIGEAANLGDDGALLEELEEMERELEEAGQAELERDLRAVNSSTPRRVGALAVPSHPTQAPQFATAPASAASDNRRDGRDEERELVELMARMTTEQPMPTPMMECF